MRVASSYPAPVMGVSTLKDRNRQRGYATEQINFRSDPTRKLTRRPPTKWKEVLVNRIDFPEQGIFFKEEKTHTYVRNGKEYKLLFRVNGNVRAFIDGVEYPVVGDLSSYVDDNESTPFITETVEDTVYIVNPLIKPRMLSGNDSVEKVSHINITSALNYGETLQVNVIKSDGTKHVVTYTIPDLGTSNPDYDTADKARATTQVAKEIAARINSGGEYPSNQFRNPAYPLDPYSSTAWQQFCNPYRSDGAGGAELNPDFDETNTVCKPYVDTYPGIEGVTAVALGSSVAVWEIGRAEWLTLEVETGQGNRSAVAINEVVEDIEGLPLYAVHGSRITVRPSPITDKGTYYLEAQRISSSPSGDPMEEVTWVQSRSPNESHELDQNRMPRICEFDGTTFFIKTGEFKDRLVGDNDSVKLPEFINKGIKAIAYFQKRLVFAVGNTVVMSETDDPKNFFRESALQLLATDPVSIASSATNVDVIDQILSHNKDLLLIASNGQFKIDGDRPVTPQTVSMTLTTSYECISDIKPVSIGNSVFFPIDYGDSVGIKEFTGERETDQDKADSITQHVIGYINGGIRDLASNSNLNMLAVVPKEIGNVLYVYEFKRNFKGDLLQEAWTKWELNEDSFILEVNFIRDKMILLVDDDNRLVTKEIDMYGDNPDAPTEIYLDNRLVLDTDGSTVTIPEEYNTNGMVIVAGNETGYELNQIPYTLNGTTISLDNPVSAGKLFLGIPYKSSYIPTRPFRYEEDGSVITDDRLRVSKFKLSLVESNEVHMKVTSAYYDEVINTFNSRYTGGINNLVGTIPLHTGDVSFAFNQDANLATAEFYCDNWLGCNIVDISWEGQYHQSSRRM